MAVTTATQPDRSQPGQPELSQPELSQSEPTAKARATDPAAPDSLDALLGLDGEQLRALYEGAKVPHLSEVRGDLRGRMLSVVALPRWLTALPEAWAATGTFPWRGKTFQPGGDGAGEGVNRVVSDRWRLFRFETHIGPSRAGDFDALHLDYDHPGNPFFIRRIEDEIRELRPGLHLGQAYLRVGGDRRLVLYFGLEDPGR